MHRAGYERTGWKKYRIGHTIKEIQLMIKRSDDSSLIDKLSRKILFRKIGWTLMLLTPLLYFSTFVACLEKGKNDREFSARDSIWLEFATAMDSNDLNFLIENSIDSLYCVDCTTNTTTDRQIYSADYLHKNLLPEFKHLSQLSSESFMTTTDSSTIKINYPIKLSGAPEGAFNLIFVLKEKDGNFYLAERTFVP